MRAQREASTGNGTNNDDELFGAYERDLRALREKHTGPIRQEIERLEAERDELDRRINEQHQRLARLTGEQRRGGRGRIGVKAVADRMGRRTRMSGEEKQRRIRDIHSAVYNALQKRRGDKLRPEEIGMSTHGMAMAEVVKVGNQLNPDKQIKYDGERRGRVYFV